MTCTTKLVSYLHQKRKVSSKHQEFYHNLFVFQSNQTMSPIDLYEKPFKEYQKGTKIIKNLPIIQKSYHFCNRNNHYPAKQHKSTDQKPSNQYIHINAKYKIKTEINDSPLNKYKRRQIYDRMDFLVRQQLRGQESLEVTPKRSLISKRQQNLNIVKQIKYRHIRLKDKVKQKYRADFNIKSLMIEKIEIQDNLLKSFCNQNLLNRVKMRGSTINDVFLNRRKKNSLHVDCWTSEKVHQQMGQSSILPWYVPNQAQQLVS